MDVNVYDDLDDFNNQYGTVQEDNQELKETIEKLQETSIKFSIEINELKRVNTNLETNISSLYKTAKAELERKNKQIADLRKDLEDAYSRRGPKKKKGPPPKKNDTQDNQILNKQFEQAQHDIQQKNKIIHCLNTELENVRKELEEKKRRFPNDDYENNKFNKRQKLENEINVENENKNYRDRFENRDNRPFNSRFKYNSRGRDHNDLRSTIELKRIHYHQSRSRSRENSFNRGRRNSQYNERFSDNNDSHEYDRNFRYNTSDKERPNYIFNKRTPERTFTSDSEPQYSSREEIRSTSTENYRTESKYIRSRSQSRGRFMEDRGDRKMYDENYKNNPLDNEILSYVTEKIDRDSGVFNSQNTESTCTPETEPQYSPVLSSCDEKAFGCTNLSIKYEEDKSNIMNQNELKPKEIEQKKCKLLDNSEENKKIITNKFSNKIENMKYIESSDLKVNRKKIETSIEETINSVVEKFSQDVNEFVPDESSVIVAKTTNNKNDNVKSKSEILEKCEGVQKSRSDLPENSETVHSKLKLDNEIVKDKTKSDGENEKHKKGTVKDKTKSEKENKRNEIKLDKETVKYKSKSEKESGKSKSKSEKESGKSKSKSEKESGKNKLKSEVEILKENSKSESIKHKKSDSDKSSKSRSRNKSEKSSKDKSTAKSETKSTKSDEDKNVKITEINKKQNSEITNEIKCELNFPQSETKTESSSCLINETNIPFLESESNSQTTCKLNFPPSNTKTESLTYVINDINIPFLESKSNTQTKSVLNFLQSNTKTTESNEQKNDKIKDINIKQIVENKEIINSKINAIKDKQDTNISLVFESNRNNSFKEITNSPSPVSNIQILSELPKANSELIKKNLGLGEHKSVIEETKSDKNTPATVKKDNENVVSTNSIICNSETNVSEIKNSQQSTCDSASLCPTFTTVSSVSVSTQPTNRGRRRRCIISIT